MSVRLLGEAQVITQCAEFILIYYPWKKGQSYRWTKSLVKNDPCALVIYAFLLSFLKEIHHHGRHNGTGMFHFIIFFRGIGLSSLEWRVA